jgi:LuxR family maltose regulon positive regulatory protein
VSRSSNGSVTAICRHKFFAPTPFVGSIRRDAIIERAGRQGSHQIVVLQGPAGHGKSTALQQIKDMCEAEGRVTGWLTLDEADNDPRRLFIHIQALVANLQENLRAEDRNDARLPMDARRGLSSDWILDQLSLIGRPVALFLDEFQTLSTRAVLSFFKEIFEHLPETLRIFIGSRSLPPPEVGLARLLVNDRVLILRSDVLRFTPQEVERFFAASEDLGISSTLIESIYTHSEGWPAALQLIRLTLRNALVRRSLVDSTARAPRELAEYLAENVLAMQPASVKEFLLHTSPLTRLCAPLCDAVVGRRNSQQVLLHLEQSGMFLRGLDPELEWFKYHTLFSSILAEQLRLQSPDVAMNVHRRAARWYFDNHYFEEALHHAIACDEHSVAADALNLWASGLIADAQLMTVERWYERLPFDQIAARPDLAIKISWALVFLRRRDKARPLLALLGQTAGSGAVQATTNPDIVLSMAAISKDDLPSAFSLIENVPIREPDTGAFAAFELGAAANLLGYRALTMQDFESTREYLALARAHNAQGDARFSSGYTVAMRGVSLLVQGSLRESLQCFREELTEQHDCDDKSFASAALISCYVWALCEANELDTADELFAQNHAIITESTLPDFLTVAFMSMVRAHDARGRPSRAEELLDEAESIAHGAGWARLVRTVNWERVRRSLLAGDFERAEQIAEADPSDTDAQPASWIPFANDAAGVEFSQIRFAIHEGKLDRAASLLEFEFKRQRGRRFRQIKLHLLQALHSVKSDAHPAAHRSLRAALKLAQPGAFVRCFLDEGEEILQLLRDEYRSLLELVGRGAVSVDREFVELLLRSSGTDLGCRSPLAGAESQSLTDRQREMLVLLVNGISNRDMAHRLFVSENTIKFHLKNIYLKLGVSSRGQASAIARQRGLVH